MVEFSTNGEDYNALPHVIIIDCWGTLEKFFTITNHEAFIWKTIDQNTKNIYTFTQEFRYINMYA